VGSGDRTAKVWDVPGGFCTHNFRGHEGYVMLVRFHPDPARELLVTAGDDHTVRMWSLGAQACVGVLRNHIGLVTGVGFSGDGRTLLTAGRDQVVCFWDLTDEKFPLLESYPTFEAMEGLVVLDDEAAREAGEGRWDNSLEQEEAHARRNERRRKGEAAPRGGHFAVAGAKGAIRVLQYRQKPEVFAKGLAVKVVAEQAGPQVYERGYMGLLHARASAQLLGVTTDHNILWVGAGDLARSRTVVGYNDEVIDVRYLSKQAPEDEDMVVVATNSPQVRGLKGCW
jgi:U3 small nucleolar RNA-associated protein 13